MLVIELDGGQHDTQQRAADDARTRRIEARGYRVLRFWNHEVLGNLDGVLSEIQSALTPTPDPSPQGGRGARFHSCRSSIRMNVVLRHLARGGERQLLRRKT
jgi:Protein of unknown function (DUF559)